MNFLESLARFQYRYAYIIVAVAVILTIAIALGVSEIRMQTDIIKEMPSNLPTIIVQNKISDSFGGEDIVMVLVRMDKKCLIKNAPKDMRDYRIIKMLVLLEEQFNKENSVNSIRSVGSFFPSSEDIPQNAETLKKIITSIPNSDAFFNNDYSATIMLIESSIGSGEESIDNFVSKLSERIDSVEKPACVDISITGNSPIRAVLMNMLQHDLVYTMGIAALIIFLILVILKRSLAKAILIFNPLIFGLVWVLGIMGWLEIPLSIATVGIGAMILGLGTEYGIFLVERYYEERKKGKNQEKSLTNSLPSVGSGIIGSGMTTIVGFLALLLASMPMMQHLGETLALGIFCILFATIIVSPSVIIAEERLLNAIEASERKSLKKRSLK